ncbi:YheC/YheD family protein [Paenibacillus psychroresistens]|uniref:YheC/YheD family protein n=1 Tax=Paenibacillus psychroresistens TaxID=1778678 RepID=A0A6B8RGX0_9BACL|nr:YheC/YheD family protein [Paenibacillus psychroresistens]QGQ94638.1 YheC/YheD family protein [Paenibacillus psychroresistens]
MKRFVVSKWKKTNELMKNDELRAHIPKTVRMTKDSLLSMLHEYRMVYIKPDIGTFGNGVMRVEWDSALSNPYQYQLGEKARSFVNYDSMYEDIERKTRKTKYLVQKGIHLLKYQKRRFDIRIMVQKNLQKEWETTGWIGRVAHPRKIVTNYHSGGKLMPIEELLKDRTKETGKKHYHKQFKQLGTNVAKQLHKRYPGIKEIGIDVALDEAIVPWILEVNTKPDPYIFRSLANKAIFGKIMRYKRANQK